MSAAVMATRSAPGYIREASIFFWS
jgi:hypothetical protein